MAKRTPGPSIADLVPEQAPGRIITPEEVLTRLPQKDGQPMFSREWVLIHVAPDKKRKLGRHVFWLETDVTAWYERWIRDALTDAERPPKRERAPRRRGQAA